VSALPPHCTELYAASFSPRFVVVASAAAGTVLCVVVVVVVVVSAAVGCARVFHDSCLVYMARITSPIMSKMLPATSSGQKPLEEWSSGGLLHLAVC